MKVDLLNILNDGAFEIHDINEKMIDAGMDSMMYIELIVTIEDYYEVQFADEMLSIASYETFADLQMYVQKLVDLKEGV